MPTFKELRISGVTPLRETIMEISAIGLYLADATTRVESGAIVTSDIPIISGSLNDLVAGNTSNVCVLDATNVRKHNLGITLTWTVEKEFKYLSWGAGDNVDRIPRYYKVEYKDLTTGVWKPFGIEATRGISISGTPPAPRTMVSLTTGSYGGQRFFDNSSSPEGLYTVSADGREWTLASGIGYYQSVSSGRAYVKGAVYYLEYAATNCIVGFVTALDYYERDPYIGNSQGPFGWTLGSSGNVIYMRRLVSGATSLSPGFAVIPPGGRVGMTLDMVDMKMTYQKSGEAPYTFDIPATMLGDVGELLYLAFCADSPGSARTVKFFNDPADFLFTPPAGAKFDLPGGTPIRAVNSYFDVPFTSEEPTASSGAVLEALITQDISTRLSDVGGAVNIPILNAGKGYIKSTVHIQGTPNVPVSRRVLLFHPSNDLAIRETVSDPTTGLYEFKYIDEAFAYNIMVQDSAGQFVTAASGPVKPKRMPGV